ncbi:MAG: c-type cytochrome [Gallionellaceae bacterium]|nr:c-type cytochrome [Gallionellaceae bacterium]
MANKYCMMLALAIGLGSGIAQAAEVGETLAKENSCLSCHNVDRRVVGPAYKDVAKKYKGDSGAAARLAIKVRNGGKGVWGQVPMPPQTKVSDADLKTIIAWVLTR